MKKKITMLVVFMMALFAIALYPASANAATYKTVGSGYVKVGSKSVRLSKGTYDVTGKLVQRTSSGTKTIKTKVISAISDGTKVYFTTQGSKKLYRWTASTGKTAAYATLPCYSDRYAPAYIRLVCGYGKNLYFSASTGMNEVDTAVYRFSISAKRSYTVKKNSFLSNQKGKNLILVGSSGDPRPVPIWVYDMSSRKLKKIVSSAFSGIISGNKYYFAQAYSKSGWTFKIRSYDLSTKKYATLSNSFKAQMVWFNSAHKAQYYSSSAGRYRTITF